MSDGDFRRMLQAYAARLGGRFSGQMAFALNSGRLCKVELLYRAKFQCDHQRKDAWSGPDNVTLNLSGAAQTARVFFEEPLRELQGDHAELIANFSNGRLDGFRYIRKAR